MSQQLSFESALACIKAQLRPARGEVVALDAAADRFLAQAVAVGKQTLPAGQRLGIAALAAIAGQGHATVSVVRRPRVGILATGDELVSPGTPLHDGCIPNSSTPVCTTCIQRWGGQPIDLGIAPDRFEAVLQHLVQGVQQSADLLVTVGGTGRGDHDFLRRLLSTHGTLLFDGIAVRGGHSLLFGTFQGCPLIALPGTPGACRLFLETVVRPAVEWASGHTAGPATVPARVVTGFRSRPLLSFEWARVTPGDTGFEARRLRGPGIGIWTSMLQANALLIVPPETERVEAGMLLEAQLLDVPAGLPLCGSGMTDEG